MRDIPEFAGFWQLLALPASLPALEPSLALRFEVPELSGKAVRSITSTTPNPGTWTMSARCIAAPRFTAGGDEDQVSSWSSGVDRGTVSVERARHAGGALMLPAGRGEEDQGSNSSLGVEHAVVPMVGNL